MGSGCGVRGARGLINWGGCCWMGGPRSVVSQHASFCVEIRSGDSRVSDIAGATSSYARWWGRDCHIRWRRVIDWSRRTLAATRWNGAGGLVVDWGACCLGTRATCYDVHGGGGGLLRAWRGSHNVDRGARGLLCAGRRYYHIYWGARSLFRTWRWCNNVDWCRRGRMVHGSRGALAATGRLWGTRRNVINWCSGGLLGARAARDHIHRGTRCLWAAAANINRSGHTIDRSCLRGRTSSAYGVVSCIVGSTSSLADSGAFGITRACRDDSRAATWYWDGREQDTLWLSTVVRRWSRAVRGWRGAGDSGTGDSGGIGGCCVDRECPEFC